MGVAAQKVNQNLPNLGYKTGSKILWGIEKERREKILTALSF